jgi:F-type H+-transporting ATPase subunit a
VPEHSTWLTVLLAAIEGAQENLTHNAVALGNTFVGNHPPTAHSFEPLLASAFIAGLLILIGVIFRSKTAALDEAVIPDDKLSLRTIVEIFLGYFYDLAKSVMGPERAQRYFPLIAGSACFVFLANVMALAPGMPVATSSLSITLGSALVVFIAFNFWGLKVQGFHYIKHLAGPVWWLSPLIFVVELISVLVRPITLALRLALNMAVDHLLLTVFAGLFSLLLPIPLMLLGIIVIAVQTLVFTLLTCIYIGLATEVEEH